uniref:Upstream transcription factor family member 3 n=1 Tax=Molossus molossus TaxID=27622 RepID=A0A7J8I379_MOLMO|nr:upstream transcription factor family member 3 [Molossus molossus]
MPEMTENETPTKKQHRKKNRETHNAVERHRKKKINAGINRIGELIPCSPALKQSKNMILDQAFKYITELKRQNDELLLNGGNNEQEIATALPDGSAMSPLLTIANSSASDSSKQSSNRPAHNISHILGHDCSSAV